MNKIYKVVWNKARNCYVVVSEFAKNHQTGSSRIKAASVAAVMAATMLTIGTGVIYAANVTDTDEKGEYQFLLPNNDYYIKLDSSKYKLVDTFGNIISRVDIKKGINQSSIFISEKIVVKPIE